MNEKVKDLLYEFLFEMPEKDKDLFENLAEYAISLGYLPKKTKTRVFNLDFTKNKVKQTIMKLEVPDKKYEGSIPGIRLKFYANKDYSQIFQDSIKRVIEAHDGRYTGCSGCGKCSGKINGYTYKYPDGKSVFRCGGELIPIIGWKDEHLVEINELIKVQDDFFTSQIIVS